MSTRLLLLLTRLPTLGQGWLKVNHSPHCAFGGFEASKYSKNFPTIHNIKSTYVLFYRGVYQSDI